MYECFKNFNRKLHDTLKPRVSKKNREKRQASSSAAPTTAVETQQPVPEPVSVELSEYEQKGKIKLGSKSQEGYLMAICFYQNFPRSLYVLSIYL